MGEVASCGIVEAVASVEDLAEETAALLFVGIIYLTRGVSVGTPEPTRPGSARLEVAGWTMT